MSKRIRVSANSSDVIVLRRKLKYREFLSFLYGERRRINKQIARLDTKIRRIKKIDFEPAKP
jgi:hypothetical protein